MKNIIELKLVDSIIKYWKYLNIVISILIRLKIIEKW
jgi:hypothetical protein